MEQDFVEYSVYPPSSVSSTEENLVNLRLQSLNILQRFIDQYMWHHDCFVLNIGTDRLYGKVTIGDNVEDEWFIIGMLFHLSKHLDVVIQVQDQDGEVLLIESADHIPKWAQEPEQAQNRVYIYQGSVHLIPIAKSPAELTPIPSGVPEPKIASQIVSKYSPVTLASDKVQNSVKSRLKNYPENWSELLHHCHVLIPVTLKPALNHPNLISAAIRCFYERDILDIRTSRQLKNVQTTQKFCKVGLSVTKCLYAMLARQNYVPDKKSSWPKLHLDHPDYKANLLGAKLSCGFEILANRKDHQDEMMEKYIQSLNNKGYFQGFLPGSKNYNELLEKAKGHMENHPSSNEFKSPTAQLLDLLKMNCNIEAEDNPETKTSLKPEDDESWLDYQPDSFDEMLKKHFNLKDDNDEADSVAKSKEEIPGEIKKFLKAMSDMSGIEEQNNDNDLDQIDETDNDIKFDPSEFEKAFKKILNIDDSNKDNSEKSDSDSEEDDGLNDDLEEMSDYYDAMSSELKDTKVGEDLEPLDIDVKLLSNLMESFKIQDGLPGPTSTLLEPLGFDLKELNKS